MHEIHTIKKKDGIKLANTALGVPKVNKFISESRQYTKQQISPNLYYINQNLVSPELKIEIKNQN